MIFKKVKKRPKLEHPDDDPTGLARAVIDFNHHKGPAKIFYNRNNKTFYTQVSPAGEDRWWSDDMVNSMDVVELYRKTTVGGDVQVTEEALKMMEGEVRPYSVW